MERLYTKMLREHFAAETKIALVAGPRQVGKTTTAQAALPAALYLNWDNQEHRALILKGPSTLMERLAGIVQKRRPGVILDELHKYNRWKTYLKGLHDTYGKQIDICVTGSARLDIYRRGGDSLMGRYFIYRVHPLSVREAIEPIPPARAGLPPRDLGAARFDRLLKFGGFPEPYLRSTARFSNRWQRLPRLEQLFREDVRDLTHISDIARIRSLAERLSGMVGGSLNYSHLANDLQVSVDTVRRWLELLESIYFCFRIRPYTRNIARSLLREPKAYLWDWAQVPDPHARQENLVASHLLKAVHYYTDAGLGNYQLWYLRDKSKREVDFLITREQTPWMLVEVKNAAQPVTAALKYFQETTRAPHAFQVAFDLPYVQADCFKEHRPVTVPVTTLLAQLV